jgi:hypothetical protein
VSLYTDVSANCKIEGFTHSRLANGVHARCCQLRPEDVADFEDIDDDDFYYASSREYIFQITRTDDTAKPLKLECTSAKTLFSDYCRRDWPELPESEDFRSAVPALVKRAMDHARESA